MRFSYTNLAQKNFLTPIQNISPRNNSIKNAGSLSGRINSIENKSYILKIKVKSTHQKKELLLSELTSHSESPVKVKKFEISIAKPITTDNSPQKLSKNISSPAKQNKIATPHIDHDYDGLCPDGRRRMKSLTAPFLKLFDIENTVQPLVKPTIARTLSLTKNVSNNYLFTTDCIPNKNYGYGNGNLGDAANSNGNKIFGNNMNSISHTLSSNNITNISSLNNLSSTSKKLTAEMILNR